MRFILFLIIFSISYLMSVYSQIEIETKSGEKIIGLYQYEDSSRIAITKLFDTSKTYIEKKFIYKKKRLCVTLTDKSGNKYNGVIESYGEGKIVLGINNYKSFVFKIEDIVLIEYHDYYKIFGYSMLGFTLFTPGGFNCILGYQFRYFGIRFEAGFMPFGKLDSWGLQGNILLNLFKSPSTEANLSITAGRSQVATANTGFMLSDYSLLSWSYYGVCFDINAYGLFIEAGLSFGEGDFTSPQLLFQIGYIFRFIK